MQSHAAAPHRQGSSLPRVHSIKSNFGRVKSRATASRPSFHLVRHIGALSCSIAAQAGDAGSSGVDHSFVYVHHHLCSFVYPRQVRLGLVASASISA